MPYADLRGIPSLLMEIPEGARLNHIDFSYGIFRLVDCQVSDCLFVRSTMSGRTISRIFERCDFTRSQCINSGIYPTLFVDCNMEGINLKNCFGYASFLRCNLQSAYFWNASLGDSRNPATLFAKCNLRNARFGFKNRALDENSDLEPAGTPKFLSNIRVIECNHWEAEWRFVDTSVVFFAPNRDSEATK